MSRSRDYFMLIGSLPALPASFEVERLPISQLRLQQRLRMLHPDDAAVLDRVADFFVWDRQQARATDEDVIAAYESFMANIENPVARELVRFRLDLRTIVASLRRRRLSLGPPAGVGPWIDQIRRHFQRPDLGLGARFPWIVELDELLGADQALEMERRLLTITWERWRRLDDRSTFGLDAVLLYLARWEILYRWTRHDADAGRGRFDALLTEALGEHRDLFA